ncbi:variable surface protein [Plasmodium gonderi]|uniref:Variable surface protein n=1 Tax=Plasmodium gonderi TaxID=77519 RepID=A0A1Y1JRQ9_PLAGO|nr:variable surface protein [Plasmodium gonderi]GAW84148.1 variable surface protein [Plasmodium gonderi]
MIEIFIYIHVPLFDEKKKLYEECKEKYKDQESDAYCKRVAEVDRQGTTDFSITCPYIYQCIYDQKENGEHIYDNVCIFLYYWLYENYYKNEGDFENVKKRYEVYLKAYAEYQQPICDYYKSNITKEVLEKLKDIYDMNTELDNIKNSKGPCSSSNSECAKKCCDIYKKYEDGCISKTKIFVFTICGSCLHNRIIRKTYLRNNLYNEWNILQEPQMTSCNSRNRTYNVLYSSD